MYRKFFVAAVCFFRCFAEGAVELQVEPKALFDETERIGINLGTWTTWGAEQFSGNILMNPGFEGYVDRVIVVNARSDVSSFSDDADWGYDDDYWKGAFFEVRTGAAKGTYGKITHSLRKGTNGLPQYVTEKPLPPLALQEIITLTKLGEDEQVPLWWIADSSKGRVSIDKIEKRLGSTGVQSLVLEPSAGAPAEVDHYLDAMADKAGKLLLVEGAWRFSFWAKSNIVGNTIHLFFRRINGEKAFFEQIVPLSDEWKEYTFDFQANDRGVPQTLQLKMGAVGDRGKVWVDDVFLGPVQPDNKTSFRQEVVDVLLKLKPSFIRDTQGQLGDTFKNRIADIYSRRAIASRAYAGVRSLSTGYSIPDLLQLCRAVGANPWIVIPPTFSGEEALALGKFLAQNANKTLFSTVIVEFGNENWNWLFRATGIPYPQTHGYIAEQIFEQVQLGAGAVVNLRKVVNGQFASPEKAVEFARSTPSADTLAIAPYLFMSMETGSSPQQNLPAMFASGQEAMKQIVDLLKPLKKNLAIYEINLHTTEGSATTHERELYTAGEAAGSALAKRLIEGMVLGIHPEMVFSLSQFDTAAQNQSRAKLWGVTRDFGVTSRLRPQGLAMIMLNGVVGGALHLLTPIEGGDELTAVAFNQHGQWKAAVVNASEVVQEIVVTFPEGKLPTSSWTLHAKAPLDTNEDAENVVVAASTLESKGRTISFTVPPWGLVVLGDESAVPL